MMKFYLVFVFVIFAEAKLRFADVRDDEKMTDNDLMSGGGEKIVHSENVDVEKKSARKAKQFWAYFPHGYDDFFPFSMKLLSKSGPP